MENRAAKASAKTQKRRAIGKRARQRVGSQARVAGGGSCAGETGVESKSNVNPSFFGATSAKSSIPKPELVLQNLNWGIA